MASLFGKGMIGTGLLYIIMAIPVLYCIRQGQRGTKYPLRKIAAVEAIAEAVGRATETGRPIHLSAGCGTMSGASARSTLAGLAFVAKASSLAAEYDAPLIATGCQPEVFAAIEETVRNSFASAGKSGAYRSEHVRFLSPLALAYTAGVIGIINREKVAASIIVGNFGGEALLLAEAGASVGAIQIAGTDNTKQIPFFVAVSDYTLIGEELYAAGAYLADDKALAGSLRGQDWGRVLTLLILVVGVVLRSLGDKTVIDLLSK